MKQKPPFIIRLLSASGIAPDKLLYILSDIASLALASLTAFGLRFLYSGFSLQWDLVLLLAVTFILSPLVALSLGLYSSPAMQPPHKRLCAIFTYVSITFAFVAIIFFLSKSGHFYSRFYILASWMIACFTVPLGRKLVEHLFCNYQWWGLPLICMDRSDTGKDLWHYLRKHPELGLRPVAFLDVPEVMTDEICEKMAAMARDYPGSVVMLAMNNAMDNGKLIATINRYFCHILIMPVKAREDRLRSFMTMPYVVNYETGFFLQQRLHDWRRLAMKRVMDLTLCICALIVLMPVFAVLAVMIRMDSKGPVFYAQRRIGRGGKEIRVHKFRTMVSNADEIIKSYLAENPELQEEWERDHKLKNDPRVTRLGRFLRRTSLDELPQLYDVVTGSMSLVGPRPIVEDEKSKYSAVFNEYIRVRPGITGLWQISGRNDTNYKDRVSYDFFYVSNWSVWFDIWILMRTVPVVLFRKGAY